MNDAASSVQSKPADAYSTGILSKDLPTEFVRLQALERWADPTSCATLRALPMADDWRCLEMGAGAGSMAYWMADACPKGRVVAADVDARFLDARRAAHLEIARVDLTEVDFPRASFDLIHARFVLAHIPQRDEILRRAVEWLAPGGAMVVEECHILPLDRLGHEEVRVMFSAFFRGLLAQGVDPDWPLSIPSRLARLGLSDLRITSLPAVSGLGGAGEDAWRLGLEQAAPLLVEKGLLTAEQAAAYRAFSKPDGIDVFGVMLSVSARRAGTSRA